MYVAKSGESILLYNYELSNNEQAPKCAYGNGR